MLVQLEKQVVLAGKDAHFVYAPDVPFQVMDVYLVPFARKDIVDIHYVIVGNTILSRFSRRTPVCMPGVHIGIFVDNLSKMDIEVEVHLQGVVITQNIQKFLQENRIL